MELCQLGLQFQVNFIFGLHTKHEFQIGQKFSKIFTLKMPFPYLSHKLIVIQLERSLITARNSKTQLSINYGRQAQLHTHQQLY